MAQNDILYFKSDNKKIGKVKEISKDKILLESDVDSKTEKILKSDLVLVLFENGTYLTFPSEYKGVDGPPESAHTSDWLATKGSEIIECTIQNADGNPVLVTAKDSSGTKEYSIPKEELAFILFANGNKQLLGTKPSVVADILKARNFANPVSFLGKYEVKPKVETGKKKGLGPELDLDKASYEQFKQKSLQKTEDLGKYLNLIANKSTESVVASKAIEQAVGLFFSDSSYVETTKSNGERHQEHIRKYLNKLKLLKYSKVLIEWTDISYVSNLRKGPDGFYYGVISLQQKFSGFIDNKLVYSDVTRKNIEIVLKTYTKEVEGETVELWDVFLNNVGISASRS